MENQVLSVDQMKELMSLGVDTTNASMLWVMWIDNYDLHLMDEIDIDFTRDVPAFSIGDLLEMLPTEITWVDEYAEDNWVIYHQEIKQSKNGCTICYVCDGDILLKSVGADILEAAYCMVKLCKQTGNL